MKSQQTDSPEGCGWSIDLASRTIRGRVVSLQPMTLDERAMDRARVVYRGPAWIGASLRSVTCTIHPEGGYTVSDDSQPMVHISSDGDAVSWFGSEGVPADSPITDFVLGPGLVLSLALKGAFSLHASAVTHRGRAIAFVGASGSGKSTLARLIGTLGSPWGWIGDDILPVSTGGEGPVAMPHFPQQKVPPKAQLALLEGIPTQVPLTAIYVLDDKVSTNSDSSLEPESGSSGEQRTGAQEVAATRLFGREAAATLLGNTIAARLFAPDLVARHLAMSSRIAEEVPIRILSYPRRMDIAPAVAEVIALAACT